MVDAATETIIPAANLAYRLFNRSVQVMPEATKAFETGLSEPANAVIQELAVFTPDFQPTEIQRDSFEQVVNESQDVIEGIWREVPDNPTPQQQHALDAKNIVIQLNEHLTSDQPEESKLSINEATLQRLTTLVFLCLLISSDPDIRRVGPLIRSITQSLHHQPGISPPPINQGDTRLAAECFGLAIIAEDQIQQTLSSSVGEGEVIDGVFRDLGPSPKLLESGAQLLGDSINQATDGIIPVAQKLFAGLPSAT
jgi:hypothetical protein